VSDGFILNNKYHITLDRMNFQSLSSIPGFPGFIYSEGPSSHPDKVHVPREITIKVEDDYLNVDDEIQDILRKLKYIETLDCRAIMDKDVIDTKRRQYTLVFRTLLKVKETQNTKFILND